MEQLEPILKLLTGKYGWLSTVFTWTTAIGFVVKLFSTKLQNRMTELMVEAATNDDNEDDVLWDRVLAWTPYKVLAYALDYLLRIKLPKLHDFQAMKKKVIVEQVAEYKAIQAEKLDL